MNFQLFFYLFKFKRVIIAEVYFNINTRVKQFVLILLKRENVTSTAKCLMNKWLDLRKSLNVKS